MHLKNGKTTANIGFIQHYLAIKASGAQKRGVEDVGAVGGSNDNNIGVFIKTVQFNKQLVECLLAFVIASRTQIVTMATHCVNLIDKHDTRRMLFCLFKEIAHSRSPDTYEHFHKF